MLNVILKGEKFQTSAPETKKKYIGHWKSCSNKSPAGRAAA
jgi:hypothetical protein